MCYRESELYILTKAVDSLKKDNNERWAIIKNASDKLEVIPEQSLALIDLETNQIIYTLKDYNHV